MFLINALMDGLRGRPLNKYMMVNALIVLLVGVACAVQMTLAVSLLAPKTYHIDTINVNEELRLLLVNFPSDFSVSKLKKKDKLEFENGRGGGDLFEKVVAGIVKLHDLFEMRESGSGIKVRMTKKEVFLRDDESFPDNGSPVLAATFEVVSTTGSGGF